MYSNFLNKPLFGGLLTDYWKQQNPGSIPEYTYARMDMVGFCQFVCQKGYGFQIIWLPERVGFWSAKCVPESARQGAFLSQFFVPVRVWIFAQIVCVWISFLGFCTSKGKGLTVPS